MGLIDAFLTQTVTIRPFIRFGDGEPIYGETETRKCRLERGKKLATTYKNPDGELDQVLADAKMFCKGDPIPDRSIVIYEGREMIVISCYVMNGFADHHLEVYLE